MNSFRPTLRWMILVCLVTQLIFMGGHPVAAQRALVDVGRVIQRRFSRGGATTAATAPSPGESPDDDDNEDNNDEPPKPKPQPKPKPKPSLWILVVAAGVSIGVLYLPDLVHGGKIKHTTTDEADAGEENAEYSIDTTDEFATTSSRGGPQTVDLSFEDIQLTLQKKKGPPRIILDPSCRGRARPGRMLAIMGPSGSGKSSLLNALAGRIQEDSKLSLEGRRYINGVPISGDSQLPAAFVEQEATFFPHMTVRETLNFRVELKLGRLLSKAARDEMVEDLLDTVNLQVAADTIVGDNKIRGISGGERKRLSVAVELISSPSLLFLDEPTSGLDSTSAHALVQTLRRLADQGKTVVAVIHQPSQHVFAQFDDLLLLSEGRLMYFGEVKAARSYMIAMGCDANSEIGTAEHVLDCISRMPVENESENEASTRMGKLAAAATNQKIDLGLVKREDGVAVRKFSLTTSGPKSGLLTQFRLLLGRSFNEVARGKAAIIIKLVQQVMVGVIYGGIYGLGNNQASIQDRFGLLSLVAIGTANLAVAASIRSFPREKQIISGEISSKLYSTLPYFVAKALAEIPLVGFFNSFFGTIVYRLTGLSKAPGKFRRFLGVLFMHGVSSEAVGLLMGAISPNSDVALALFPAVLVLNIIFDGKNISEENTPKLLRWIPKVGLIRWGFEGLCVNEFEGLTFDASGPPRGPIAKTGQEALSRLGLGEKSLGDVLQAQSTIILSCWALSYLGLSLTRQRFMTMKSPQDKSSGAPSS